jgi:hypothetical protein
VRANIW